jgi:TolB-like protein/Flp pilus assembly protein TadD
LDPVKRLLLRDRQSVSIAPKVFETLLVLVQRSKRVVGKAELMRLIWLDTFVEESNLSQNIFVLRKILGNTPEGRPYIETVPRRGYRFTASVRGLPGENAEGEVTLSSLTRADVGATQVIALREDVTLALAVMPMINASGNPEIEYISDGITESIINNLSQISCLRVIARSAVFSYKGREIVIQEVRRNLGVHAIVMGRVLLQGEILNVQTELVDVSNESQIWGEQYHLKISDVFAVQEEISQEISERLRLRLTYQERKRLTKRPPINSEAYHLYLKGRYYQNKLTEEGLKKGVECLLESIAMEPGFALAYASLAICYALGGLPLDQEFALAYAELDDCHAFIGPPPREAMSKAKAAALRTLEIDDTLAEAHASLGFIRYRLDWDWPAAEQSYLRAIEINPSYATVHHWYSMCLRTMGRLDEALTEARLAQKLDPSMLIAGVELGRIYYFAREYDEAIAQYKKTLEMDPSFLAAHFRLGQAYVQRGMYDEAISEFNKSHPLLGDDPETIAALGHAYAVSGNRKEALGILNNLLLLAIHRYVSPYDIAVMHLGLGEKDKALEWLQNAYADRSVWLIGLKVEPMLDDLRSDPRFNELLRRVGFAA